MFDRIQDERSPLERDVDEHIRSLSSVAEWAERARKSREHLDVIAPNLLIVSDALLALNLMWSAAKKRGAE